MVTLSFRMNKKKLAIAAAACIAVAAALLAQSLFQWAGALPPVFSAGGSPSRKGQTEEQRQQFIAAYGWAVDAEPFTVAEVLIPEEFDETYENYNQIQQAQGFDLARYKGKRCKRYTYQVTNYPARTTGVQLNLLVYNGKIIGGDLCSLEAGGFLHGFVPAGEGA